MTALTPEQADGVNCLRCDRIADPGVPVGTVDGCQVFACAECHKAVGDSAPPAAPASEQLVLSAHTVSVLARQLAGDLPLNHTGQALAAALDDVAALAAAWVQAQLHALDSAPEWPAQAAVGPLVTPSAAQPATDPQPVTATAAVLAATSQLPQGATARNIAAHVAAVHALEVTPETVRAIRSKHRRGQAQPAPQPTPQQGTGMYL